MKTDPHVDEEEFEDEIITLYDDNNNAVDFILLDEVEYDNELFVVLKPKGKLEGVGDDEVVIFKLEEPETDDSDDYRIVPVESEQLLEKVFEVFMSGGDCDCDDCDCHDDDECDCHDDDCGCKKK